MHNEADLLMKYNKIDSKNAQHAVADPKRRIVQFCQKRPTRSGRALWSFKICTTTKENFVIPYKNNTTATLKR